MLQCVINMMFGIDVAVLIRESLSVESFCMEIPVVTLWHYSQSTDGDFRDRTVSSLLNVMFTTERGDL